jgi:hypothetical protein
VPSTPANLQKKDWNKSSTVSADGDFPLTNLPASVGAKAKLLAAVMLDKILQGPRDAVPNTPSVGEEAVAAFNKDFASYASIGTKNINKNCLLDISLTITGLKDDVLKINLQLSIRDSAGNASQDKAFLDAEAKEILKALAAELNKK